MQEIEKMNDKELILALERAVAQLKARRQNAGEIEASAIKHNLHAANLILGSYKSSSELVQVQRELAVRIIDRANKKERIKLYYD
jgi:hypothetical protein